MRQANKEIASHDPQISLHWRYTLPHLRRRFCKLIASKSVHVLFSRSPKIKVRAQFTMKVFSVLLPGLLLSLVPYGINGQCGYDTCPKTEPGMLNVHLVPHTHDDTGWLKTVDQYYYGSRRGITPVGVQYIFDSVIPELVADPTKRFIYVEIAFFWRWWQEQDDRMRSKVQTIVRNGQLEFINGGWCMNDEAATHYNAIIDQMTWGFRKINDTFGECARPRVAWQIDPFGHSREQANLFAQMGFDGLFFGRLDYQDKEERLRVKNMETIWKGSDSLGKSSWLFTGALFNNYSPPRGFCFDIFCDDEPIMDDPTMHDYNVNRRVNEFIDAVKEWKGGYQGNHLMMTMGEDFNYNNARTWYKNLDKLIKHTNDRQKAGLKINLLYSTPSCYLKSVHETNPIKTTKSDDFFPYASDPHAYWTGYFTSRPALKGMVRTANNFLQVCKQMGALTNQDWTPGPDGDVSIMRNAVAVAQHHDAVSGTAKQAVTFDYAQRLAEGFAECRKVIDFAYKFLLPTNAQESSAPVKGPEQVFCPLLNITECAVTEKSDQFVVNIYNPLGREVSKWVRIPVSSNGYEVLSGESKSKPVKAQIIPVPKSIQVIPGRQSNATHELVFKAIVPAVGFKSFFVRKNPAMAKAQATSQIKITKKTIFGNAKLQVGTNKYGAINRIMANNKVLSVNHDFAWYEGHSGDNRGFNRRASGAYIFRPAQQKPTPLAAKANPVLYKGHLFEELHLNYAKYVNQIVRVYLDSDDLEMEWVVGPIPVKDGKGKEIISRFSSNIKTKGTFFTDSNGRQMLKRVRNFRPTWNMTVFEPVAGNYFPVNSRIAMNDGKTFVTVLTDRSQGGSSINDGELELMVHRRLLYDDAFGVGEALNEKAFGQGLVVRGKHWLQVSADSNEASRKHRFRGQEAFMDVSISFTPTKLSFEEWSKTYKMSYSSVNPNVLPKNVHLLTMEEWTGNGRDSVLIRVENFFDAHEDPEYSKPVTFSLKDLLADFDIVDAEEVTLGANLNRDKLQRLEWRVKQDNNIEASSEEEGDYVKLDKATLDVSLNPMEIRTFIISLRAKRN